METVILFSRSKNNSEDAVNDSPKEDWSVLITRLEKFYKNNDFRGKSMNITSYVEITDLDRFFTAHLQTVIQNNGVESYLPYLNRLLFIEKKLKKVK